MDFAELRPLKNGRGRVALLLAIACFVVEDVQADTFYYSDVDGTQLTYSNISETNDTQLPLFGQPELLEEVLFVQGSGFRSNSTTTNFDFSQGILTMTIEADPGTLIDSIQLDEFGSYFVVGDDSSAAVSTQGFVEANGQFHFGELAFDSDGGSGVWESSFSINFPETRLVNLTINSQIYSSSSTLPDRVSFIDKAGSIITVGTISTIPEPGQAAMLILASGLIATYRSRER